MVGTLLNPFAKAGGIAYWDEFIDPQNPNVLVFVGVHRTAIGRGRHFERAPKIAEARGKALAELADVRFGRWCVWFANRRKPFVCPLEEWNES